MADPETLRQLAGFSERQIRMETGVRRDAIRSIRHGKGVKRSTYERIINFLKENTSCDSSNADEQLLFDGRRFSDSSGVKLNPAVVVRRRAGASLYGLLRPHAPQFLNSCLTV